MKYLLQKDRLHNIENSANILNHFSFFYSKLPKVSGLD